MSVSGKSRGSTYFGDTKTGIKHIVNEIDPRGKLPHVEKPLSMSKNRKCTLLF